MPLRINTGDAEKQVEYQMMDSGLTLKSNVIKAGFINLYEIPSEIEVGRASSKVIPLADLNPVKAKPAFKILKPMFKLGFLS